MDTELTEEEKFALVEKKKRDKQLADGLIYRTKNKDKLLAYNRAYFQKRKNDTEFIKKQRESISISKKKRRIENKKGDEGIPKRPYIRKPPTPQDI